MTGTIDIELSAPVNLRDLGGIPIGEGTVRPGFAIRTDDLAYVTEDFAQKMVTDGLTAIIDLRSAREVSATGRGPLGHTATAYHHLPLIADVVGSLPKNMPRFTHESMGEMYVTMVNNAAPQLVTALNVIALTPGTTAFHCAAGRDRTGVLAAMLLLALGAGDDDIVTDYARTGDNMVAIFERSRPVMAAMWSALGLNHDAQQATSLLDGQMDVSMRILLTALRNDHGDPLGPLYAAGLSSDTIARLRRRATGR